MEAMLRISEQSKIGQEFVGVKKKITAPRLLMFSAGPIGSDGWPQMNHHTDHDTARCVGLKSMIASATQTQGYVCQLMIEIFGEAWLTNGGMDVKFIDTLEIGESVTCTATIESKESQLDGTLFTLKTWCATEAGKKVLVGTVFGLA